MAELIGWTEISGWQKTWEATRALGEDLDERNKRYGLVRNVKFYKERIEVVFFLARQAPRHPWIYRFGLPLDMEAYRLEAKVRGTDLRVVGYMQGPHTQLCGLINSFPEKFITDIPLDVAVGEPSIEWVDKYTAKVLVKRLSQ